MRSAKASLKPRILVKRGLIYLIPLAAQEALSPAMRWAFFQPRFSQLPCASQRWGLGRNGTKNQRKPWLKFVLVRTGEL